jgi:hypothetical protein
MESWMNRIAALTLLILLSAGWSIPAKAQRLNMAESARLSQKTAEKQQKMDRKAARKQQKAIKKYNKAQQKAQRKAAKRWNHHNKRTS